MPHYMDLKPRGIRKSSLVVAAPVTGAAAALYTLTIAGAVARTCIVRKLMCHNGVGNSDITLGIGLAGAFAAILPPFYSLLLFDAEWMEDEIPEVEVSQDITVESTVAGVLVQIEVEEIGT